ncbi:GH3 auxin-responsive promoter-domain-containing protein [Suillus tomentosus]|nr:GH3 auxin-responsive promoter-domain-containing protein [Suillus tomentosus]
MSRPDTDLLDSSSAELTQRYAQYAPELANFREAIAQNDSKDDIDFLHSFREFVPTRDYEPHKPYIAKTALLLSHVQHDIWQIIKDVSNILARSALVAPPSISVASSFRGEDGQSSKTLPVCSLTVGFLRMQKNWDIVHGMDRLNLWVPGKTDSYATSLVKDFRAFFLLNALFAFADRRVTIICFLFTNVFGSFQTEKLDHLRKPLEVKHFTPNPIRAAELCEIGPPGIQGWAFIGITRGSTAASVPKARQMWKAPYHGSSKCFIAVPYFSGNPETDFKVVPVDGVTEYLDVRFNEPSERVLSAWELETGGHYDPVLTTRNGMWRYRIGDSVVVKGFAPDDRLPVINYLHRREVATNKRDQIEGEIGKDAEKAVQHTFEDLAENNEYHLAFLQARGRKPTIGLMEKGTFTEYRRQKCDKTNISMGQVKVPIVLSNETLKEWFLRRVVMEL